MIGYVTLGTNDFERAIEFYDALLSRVDISRQWKSDTMAAWGEPEQQTLLCVAKPFDAEAATVGNGVMVALKMKNASEVQALHAEALALGGQDEGAPGPRGSMGFYGAYFRDLDGNKLNAYVPAGG